VNAHICCAKSTASRFLERGQSTAIASGPAAVAAIVTEAGMWRRRRMSGIATEATTTAAAAARTRARGPELDLRLLLDHAK
jgi:hypothetical protein